MVQAAARTRPTTAAALLEVRGLTVEFRTSAGAIRANEDVSLAIARGTTLGLVGESGSGKSVLCRSILRLVPSPPAFVTAGEVWFDGRDLLKVPDDEMRRVRGTRIRMVAIRTSRL